MTKKTFLTFYIVTPGLLGENLVINKFSKTRYKLVWSGDSSKNVYNFSRCIL